MLQITFDSIGDGVITTDTKRNVVSLNKVAEEKNHLKDVLNKKISMKS